MFIPSQIIIGDSSKWSDFSTQDNLGNIIASPDWALFYALNGPAKLTLTSSPLDSGWSTELTAHDSALLTAGVYFWQAYATKGSERITLGEGKLLLKSNMGIELANFDGRTQARKDLDNVQTAIRAMISNGAVQEYKINNRELKKMQLGDLRALESQLKFEVNREERARKIKNGEGDPFNLKIRFR